MPRPLKGVKRSTPIVVVPYREWGKLLFEFKRAGYTRKAILDCTGLSAYQYDQILLKKLEPDYHTGEVLLKLKERISND